MHRRVGFLADDFELCNTRERGDEFGSEGVVLSMIFRPSKNKKAPRGAYLFCYLAERTGLEPATPGVTGRYSNQLNYRSAAINYQKLASPRGFEPLYSP